jgi:hypothetical protein
MTHVYFSGRVGKHLKAVELFFFLVLAGPVRIVLGPVFLPFELYVLRIIFIQCWASLIR